ncbi:MAG: anti-sigma factor family protein [Candidatus Zhuqueibacterota bacterium]
MKCHQVKKKLSAFQDGEVSESLKLDIQRHLRECPDCSAILRRMEQVWSQLSNAETITSAPYFWARLSHRIQRQDAQKRFIDRLAAPFSLLPKPVITTLVFLIGIMIGIYLGKSIYKDANAPISITLEQEMEQQTSVSSFSDLPANSVSEIYASMIADNNEPKGTNK